ncbi:MAG: HD domain-containing protein [Treponema sp.]|nr:HD domain-containing protein [Treponema sp.]
MPDQKDSFFDENIERINHLSVRILLAGNIVPVLLFILTRLGIFHIPGQVLFFAQILLIFSSFIDFFLLKIISNIKLRSENYDAYKKIQNFSKYFTPLIVNIIIGFLATQSHIGIYISWSFVVFLSCLYYDIKLTRIMSIIGYIILLIAQYFKSCNRYVEGLTEGNSLLFDFFAFSAGYTMEWIFVYLIATTISKRSHKTLQIAIQQGEALKKSQLDFMQFIPVMLKKHEIITGCHVEHTVQYVEMICNELRYQGFYTDDLTDDNIKLFSAAANLHDIGKIYIPDHILNKPGRYTPQEYEMMQEHPTRGKEIIEAMPELEGGRFNEIAIQMAYCHHEKWDGTGYPRKIARTEIPLCARIMAVADVIDALLSFRPYKQPIDIDHAMQILEEGKGTQFEPCIVDAAVALKPLIFALSQEFRTNEAESIEEEMKFREKERESLLKGHTITEQQQKEIEHNN